MRKSTILPSAVNCLLSYFISSVDAERKLFGDARYEPRRVATFEMQRDAETRSGTTLQSTSLRLQMDDWRMVRLLRHVWNRYSMRRKEKTATDGLFRGP